jgi:hypothetical protein
MIKLYFKEFHDLELLAKGAKSHIIRLFVDMQFKAREGWTKPYSAILDTGAHASLIPFRIWSKCPINFTAQYVIRGVVPKEECSLPILIGDISCVLVDRERQSEQLKISAYLALTMTFHLSWAFGTCWKDSSSVWTTAIRKPIWRESKVER